MKNKLLVLADNHGDLDEMVQVINHEQANLVVHAGDYNLPINTMKQYFDYFVDGNNDYDYQKQIIFTFGNKKFLLLHGDEYWTFNQAKWHDRLRKVGKDNSVDIVIYGHSHISVIDKSSHPIVINPGSISLPRNPERLKTYLVIEFDNEKIHFIIKHL